MNETSKCHYCEVSGAVEELRNYGPEGAPVCITCAYATPERAATTDAAIDALLNAGVAASPHGIAVIGGPEGPTPFVEKDGLHD